ncbi:YlaH-like family protein [Alkalihalobacillus sp. R86527]|uniref:YlaH-like family protein n=1 Tax=Alkalihalobacillus sp. R86527 TaxID=3093863 RepID=UPI003672BC95
MNNEVVPSGDLSFFARLVGIEENTVLGFYLLYAIIVILSIVVYRLGFAKKLPILKNAVIYITLIIGCLPLTFFGIGLPVAEGLVAAAVVLIIYKVRLKQSKKNQNEAG